MNANRTRFTPAEQQAFEPAEKIGLVASIDPAGRPHITLITSIMAPRPDLITLGEFCRGLSKQHIQQNPQVAFLIMTLDRRLWRGRARWTHLRREGPEYQRYNEIPMFRYNTYFGINTVHYLDLVAATAPARLPMAAIAAGALLTRWGKGAAATGDPARILKPFAEALFNQLGSLKFISYVGPDGFPALIPAIQCQAADSRRLAFAPLPFGAELGRLQSGMEVAVFGLTMGMEDVLIRGTFRGFQPCRLVRLGLVDIEWVYNSMPPAHGQIYPEVPLAPVTEF
jgi:hypothetical protein